MDAFERTSQVSLMGDIYKRASEVFVLLEEETVSGRSDMAMKTIEKLGNDKDLHKSVPCGMIHMTKPKRHHIRKVYPSIGYFSVEDIQELLHRPWSRAWTL